MRFPSAIYAAIVISSGPLAGLAQPNGNRRKKKRIRARDNFADGIKNEGRDARVVLESLDIGGDTNDLDLVARSAFTESSMIRACETCNLRSMPDTGVQIFTSTATSDLFTVLAANTKNGKTNGLSFNKRDNKKLYGVRQNNRREPMQAKEEPSYVDPNWQPNEPIDLFPDRTRQLLRKQETTIEPRGDNLEELLKNDSRFHHGGFEYKQSERKLQSGYYTDEEGLDYSYWVDLVIDVDSDFVNNSPGGNQAGALVYIDLLVSASNTVYEKEADTHLNVQEVVFTTTRYSSSSSTSNALSTLRNTYNPSSGWRFWLPPASRWADGAELYHALLGRELGGGVAYLGVLCNEDYGYGVSANMDGDYTGLAGPLVWDIMVFAHEVGHNFNAGHSHDGYDPIVDTCGLGDCTGFPKEGAASIMSYCHQCGDETNMALSMGGYRTAADIWVNDEELQANGLSFQPYRVAKKMHDHVSSQTGSCAELPDLVTAAPVTTVTAAPITPAPVTPAPVTPAPITPAPATPAPIDTTPAPVTATPVTPAPVVITPAPVTPAPVTPAPVVITPAPVTPAPVTPAPVVITPAPVTPAPVTPAPVVITPAPVTPAPVTPAPVVITPAPVTEAPITPAPVVMDGELMFYEILPNPSGVSDSDGEYVALYNPSSSDIALNGNYEICRRRGGACTTLSSGTAPKNDGTFVGCRNAGYVGYSFCDEDLNFDMANWQSDTLDLYKNGELIESVTYGFALFNGGRCWKRNASGAWDYGACEIV